jgi:hypothetical protein
MLTQYFPGVIAFANASMMDSAWWINNSFWFMSSIPYELRMMAFPKYLQQASGESAALIVWAMGGEHAQPYVLWEI